MNDGEITVADAAELTARQELVARHYVRCGNAAQVGRQLGLTRQTISATLVLEHVAAFVKALRRQQLQQLDMDKAGVIARLVNIARHDPTEVVQVRQIACPHCWDAWYDKEYRKWKTVNRRRRKDRRSPLPLRPAGPDAECRGCRGDGAREVWMADTRDLPLAERQAISSIKRGEFGIEVKMDDRVRALVEIAKLLDLYPKKDADKTDDDLVELVLNGVRLEPPKAPEPTP